MLFQKTITTHEYITGNREVNWYFEHQEGNEFGYLVIITNGRIDREQRYEAKEFYELIEKTKQLIPECWEGWNGDNFNHNYNYMTPENFAETMYEEVA